MAAEEALWEPIVDTNGSDFTIYNIPFGVFQNENRMQNEPRCATAIGNYVVDLYACVESGLFESAGFDTTVLQQSSLNDFMASGRQAWQEARGILQSLLGTSDSPLLQNEDLRNNILHAAEECTMVMPARIGDYTDFYSSIHHARNVGTMFRGAENALKENWCHLPVGYHGRASSVVISGTPIKRPNGQTKPANENPVDGPCARMDFEVELAFFVGPGNEMGTRIPVSSAMDNIFGVVLMNDWSARDIQKWEYVPLGPFNGKNFATTISPWIVTMDALEAFQCAPLPREEKNGAVIEPLPYLTDECNTNFEINLDVYIHPRDGNREHIGSTSSTSLYWTFQQQLAHHTSTGCPMKPGDLCGSGTISGVEKGSFGSMLEISWSGKEPITLSDGSQRTFLEDYDNVIMAGYCERDGKRIGFGECSGVLMPADKKSLL